MQPRITVSTHYEGVSHTWYPADEKCHAFGTLNFGATEVHLYAPAEIDVIIAELVALRTEMAPPPAGPGGVLFPAGDEGDEDGPMDDDAELRRAEAKPAPSPSGGCEARSPGFNYYLCTLDAGHGGRHEGGGAIPLPVWSDGDIAVEYVSDEAAAVSA